MRRTVQVKRSAITQTRIADAALAPLGDGEVRLKIESFSVTANNVTYAVAGDTFGYWNFFPGEGDWGVVPMWGHAVIAESRCPDLMVGERVYGYLPMAESLDVLPEKVSPGGFTDAAAHRLPMSPVYNQYSRLNADPEHDPAREGERMIFGPLFKTGFLIESFLRREGWFGAEVLICTSASSKTAMATASVARGNSPGIKRIGLTSPGNVEFVRRGGFYDEVLSYDQIEQLPPAASVLIDFAGNARVIRAVHTALRDHLSYSCRVGATHVGEGTGKDNGPLPGPTPTMFFAPHHAVALIQELGPKAFGEAVAASWIRFVGEVDEAVTIDQRSGLDAAAEAYVATAEGRADPSVGIVIRP